ncbi:MAG: ABC transporter ATP-binding protein [Myxococcota bacterium]|nr:ABC transporter ATP-binding protein [Myxococcota bacterium]
MTAKPLLAFEDVALNLGGQEVLRGVSLVVRPGEVLGLLGRNGAGKTSLIRMATRQWTPSRGSVRLDGRPIDSVSRRELARSLATVPQDVHVPFPFRAGEVVLMGRIPHQRSLGFETAEDLEIARAAMAEVGVLSLADRPIDELSGGERQLVLFARALAQRPACLLLDEPTAFLDLRHRMDVLEVVRRFAANGGAAIVVSHDFSLAARVCDRIAVLAGGRVVADGLPREVLSREGVAAGFGVDVHILEAPDGSPVVVPRFRA